MAADAVIDQLAIEIEANAMNSVNGIRRLSQAMNALANSVTRVNSAGLSNVSAQLGALSQNTTATTTGTRRYTLSLGSLFTASNRAANSSKSLAYYMGKIYANCFLLIRGVKALGNATKSAMDYIEAFNFFDVAINSATAKTSEWEELGYDTAEAYARAFEQSLSDLNEKMSGFTVNVDTGNIEPSNMPNLGLNITELQTYQAEIVSVTSSLGLMTQTSIDAAKGMSRLTADMSSLKNIDLDTVMTNFQSGLIGQSRALYKYGIDITNATLQTYAYAYGVTKSVSEMTQAEKMQLRLIAIMDQSKVAWGDLANTIEQPANQLRVFQNGVKNLAITIGKLLLPIVSGVLPYLNAMVKALQTLFTWIANIAGVELDVSNSGTGSSDIFDDIEDSADTAADSVNALNKAMNTTLGIDELNINSPSTDSSSGSGAGSGSSIDLSDAISAAMAEYEKAWEEAYARMQDRSTEMADAIVEAFKNKDYKGIGTYISTGITDALNSINWPTVYNVSSQFGSGFAEFLNGLITPELFNTVGTTIANALNTNIYTAIAFGESLDWDNIGASIGAGINGIFTNYDFGAMAESLNVWVDGLETAIVKALKTVSWGDVLKGIGDFLSNIEIDTVAFIIGALSIKKFKRIDIGQVGRVTREIVRAISNKIKGVTIPDLLINFKNIAIGANGMGTAGFDTVVFGILEAIDNALTSVMPEASAFFGDFLVGFCAAGAATAGNPIAAIIGGIFTSFPIDINWFGEGGVFSFEWTSEWFERAKKAFSTAFDGNRADIIDIGSYILEGILDGFVGAFSFITEPIAKFFKSIYDGICDLFGINSPAEEMNPLGEYILLGIVEGFVASFYKMTNAIGDFFEDVVVKGLSVETWKKNIGSVSDALKSKWSDAITWWNSKPALASVSVTVSNFLDGVKSTWYNVSKWWSDNVKLKIPDIGFHVEYSKNNLNMVQQGIVTALGLEGWPQFKFYEQGGYPSSADLFYANENGVPELVGTMNGRTAVASGTEITGISDAVYSSAEAEMQLLREQNSLLRQLLEKDTTTYIGDKQIAQSARRGERQLGLQIRTT